MRTIAVAIVLVAVAATLARAGNSIGVDPKPGPGIMSPEEQALVADVARGAQHGVVLLEETKRDDDLGTSSEIAYHMRAKILSPEARGLADIAIPFEKGSSDLKSWWGHTILPDGRVIDLPESELKTQSIAKNTVGELQELRGALPGVVPGCVIDYGYVLRQEGISSSTRVFLQKQWPVRTLHYRWTPSRFHSAAYATSRTEGQSIDVKRDARTVLVTAHDLDPVPEEPHMPPMDEARASAIFYYTESGTADDYWELEAKRAEASVKAFMGSKSVIKDVLETMSIPADAPLAEKLRVAYEWLGQHVKNTMLMSAEEEENAGDHENEAYNAKTVLKAKEGTSRQLDYLFACMARALGAEANIVFAVDRTDRYWRKGYKSMGQFGYTFVAVRAHGESDGSLVFVDAGSGLPYGQVPWRAAGAPALMCTAKGSVSIIIPPASPALNRADTHVTLAFAEDNDTMLAKWSRTANGATGLEYRRWLRDLDPPKRKEILDDLCGASGTTEVTAAELPELNEATAPYQIACDIELSNMNAGGDIAWYSLLLTGPWSPETPQFTAPTRVHPVIFDYPKVDIVGIDVTAPHGFKPMDPPKTITLESTYGRYQLFFAKTPTGFHVDRAFALTVLLAKPAEYDALRKFLDDVQKADQTTVRFEREGSAK